jgi:hypothetical protein
MQIRVFLYLHLHHDAFIPLGSLLPVGPSAQGQKPRGGGMERVHGW